MIEWAVIVGRRSPGCFFWLFPGRMSSVSGIRGMAPLAAYLIFVTTLSALAAVLFGMIMTLLAAYGREAVLDRPSGTLMFLFLGFAPGFLMGSWLIRAPAARTAPGE